jgi:glyoxylase-like metal-dependent hydrolase (beta-lactamase superfamily II)
MIQLHQFIFNDFSENTYVLWDETGECVIIDPGCYYENERGDLKKFIEGKKLKPVLLLNTHCHIDHVFGNKWVKENFQVPFYAHLADLFLLNAAVVTGGMYGLHVEASPQPDRFIREGETISYGNTTLRIFEAPGHSPGSICFYNEKEKFVISGDVLFQRSIGRFDLPGGDYEALMQSIFSKLLTLPEDVKVYSGHGPVTTVGEEKRLNPFVQEYATTMKER